MLTWIYLVSVLAISHSWILKASEKRVAKKLTNNVTFECRYDGNDNEEAKLAHVSRIRILKLRPGNKWETVAKMSDANPKVITSFSYEPEAHGHAGNRTNSFLSLRFEIATNDVIGNFLCEIDGYDVYDELTAVKTDPVIVSERGVSYDDLLKIILHLKSDEESAHTSNDLRIGLLEKTVRLLERQGHSRSKAIAKLTNTLNVMNTNFMKVSDDLMKKQIKILNDLNILKDVSKIQRQAWPEGTYTLFNTTYGCPDSFSFDWTTSSLRITTQQGNTNTDKTSTPIHVLGPVVESSGSNHYVNMRFCTKKMDVAGPAWPKGSYCINQYATVCPKNLVSGIIQFDRENIGGTDAATDLASSVRNGDITQIKYCCRNDGDAETPILLPAKNPFYLYRVGGKCQEVIGMDVSEEWIYFDTKESKDAFIGNTVHPDATLQNIKLLLCYYTPKKF